MERKIGEIFEYNGEWYQCVEGETICSECDLRNIICQRDTSINNPFKECSGNYRTDKKNIIFKKLEKVGEPYMTGNKLIQRYKIYPTTYCINVYGWYYQNLDVKSWTIDIEIKQTKEDMEEKYKAEDLPLTRLVGRYVNNLIDYDDFEKEVKALYSCKEESKPTLKPFDLEAAIQGKPVCTRDGRKARIVCFDAKGCYPIIALTAELDNTEDITKCAEDGISSYHKNDDLMMLPGKKEGWVNVYKDSVYDTKDEAIDATYEGRGYIDTVKISWEE